MLFLLYSDNFVEEGMTCLINKCYLHLCFVNFGNKYRRDIKKRKEIDR